MINLVEAPMGRMIENLDKKTFVDKVSPYVNKEVVDFMLEDERVEVTYNKCNKVCRFDFVNVEGILDEEFTQKDLLYYDDEYDYEFINIDIHFNKDKIVFGLTMETVESMLECIKPEYHESVIKEYDKLKSDLKSKGFYFELSNCSYLDLISNSLKSLTVKEVSDALNKIERFKKDNCWV